MCQLLENWSPYVLHVHCYGHRFNLVVKTLSDLDIISDIEDLVKVVHAYFAHSPKKYSEFHSLALLMETKGLKLLKNVCTRWCSLIHRCLQRCLQIERTRSGGERHL